MGSPLSPILSDIVLDDLETYCPCLLVLNVHSYFRYVDDIFIIIPRNKLHHVLVVFNSYNNRLQFTYEIEKDGMISFLDTTVI